jgi:outer membrane protein OmpA-like peptidoglycan-associated protein
MRIARGRQIGQAALLVATGLLALPVPGAAQIPTGTYIAAGIGADFPVTGSVQPQGALRSATNGSGEFGYSNRPMGLLTLGYGFGNGVRVELEGSLRGNTVTSAAGFAGLSPIGASQGQLWNFGLMGNALFELNVGSPYIQPYIGAGLGYAWTELKDARVVGNGLRFEGDGTDGNFAYQFIAGAAFPIRSVPGLAATLEYRYFATLDPDFTGRVVNTTTQATTSGRVDLQNQHHSLMVGLRYALGPQPQPVPLLATPPMLAPAVAPVPVTRTYIVFFDRNSATLDARARQIVGEAAQAARGGGSTRIEVTGHTDTAGQAASNMVLSLRRAQVVAAELRRLGVRREEIVTRGLGETQLAVPTADGVREPQNRRVEILLR